MKISSLAIGIILIITSCTGTKQNDPETPVISISILPQKYFLEQLAGDKIEVNVMVPPGASPATYEPTVSQLSQLDRSDMYFMVGHLGFENSWMEKISSVNPAMEVVDLSKGLELIYGQEEIKHEGHTHGPENPDPHIWMSVRNAEIMAQHMAKALFSLLPEDSLLLANRRDKLLERMKELDREIQNLLSETKGRSFMIYHPSLGYFAKDYHLKQHALEWEGKSPSPSHMKKLSDLGKEEQISSILIQVEFDRKNAEILASEIGAQLVLINPLDENWPDQMLMIATKLKEQW